MPVFNTNQMSDYTVSGPSFGGTIPLVGKQPSTELCNKMGELLKDAVFTQWVKEQTGIENLASHRFTLVVQDDGIKLALNRREYYFPGALRSCRPTMTTEILSSQLTEQFTTRQDDPNYHIQQSHMIPIIELAQRLFGKETPSASAQPTEPPEHAALARMERMHQSVVNIVHHLIDRGYSPQDLPTAVRESVHAHVERSEPNLTEDIIQLRQQLQTSEAALQAQKAQSEQLSQQMQTLTEEKAALAKTLAQAQASLNVAQAEQTAITQQHKQQLITNQARVAAAPTTQDERISFRETVAEEDTSQIDDLQNRIERALAKCQDLDTQYAAAQTENSRLQAQLAEFETTQTQVKDLQQTLKENTQQMAKLQDDLDAANAELEEATAARNQIHAQHNTEIDRLKRVHSDQITHLQAEINTQATEIRSLTEHYESSTKTLNTQLKNAQTEFQAQTLQQQQDIQALEMLLEANAAKYYQDKTQLIQEIRSDFANETTDLQAQLQALRNAQQEQTANHAAQIAELEAEKANITLEYTQQAQAAWGKIQAAWAYGQQQIEAQGHTIEQLASKNQELNALSQSLATRIEGKDKAIALLDEEVRVREQNSANLQEIVENQEANRAYLEDALTTSQADFAAFKEQTIEFLAEAQTQGYESGYSESQARIQELLRETVRLEREMAQVKTDQEAQSLTASALKRALDAILQEYDDAARQHRQEKNQIDAQLFSLKDQAANLELQLNQKQDAIAALTRDLKQQRQDSTGTIETLQSELDQHKKTSQQELQRAQVHYQNNLQSLNQTYDAERTNLLQLQRASTEQIDVLRAQLTQAAEENTKAAHELTVAQDAHKTIKQKFDESEDKYKQLNTRYAALQDMSPEDIAALLVSTEELQTLQAGRDNRNTTQQAEIARLKAEIAEYERENASNQEVLEEATTRAQRAQERAEAAQDALAETLADMHTLTAENEELRELASETATFQLKAQQAQEQLQQIIAALHEHSRQGALAPLSQLFQNVLGTTSLTT